MKQEVPIWEKTLLTLEEASILTGIGINKLRKMAQEEDSFLVMNESRRLFNKERLCKYLNGVKKI